MKHLVTDIRQYNDAQEVINSLLEQKTNEELNAICIALDNLIHSMNWNDPYYQDSFMAQDCADAGYDPAYTNIFKLSIISAGLKCYLAE